MDIILTAAIHRSWLVVIGVLALFAHHLSADLSSRDEMTMDLQGLINFHPRENSVDRRANLTLREFIEKYDAKRPVLITDIMTSWAASSKWNKDFFLKNYGDTRIVMKAVQGSLKNAETLALPLQLFLKHSHQGSPGAWTYLEDELFLAMNPELLKDIQTPVYLEEDYFELLPKELRPWNAMLLWGTAFSRSALHIDPYNWTGTNAVITGKKLWKLYPPGQDDFLYVRRGQHCGFPLDCFKYNSPVDAFNPDLNKYPKFADAEALEFTQHPGEFLIIPTGWFHQAFNLEETVAISSQFMNNQSGSQIIEEILKAGDVPTHKLPKDFHTLSPMNKMNAIVKVIPKSIIQKGLKVTEDIKKSMQQLPRKGDEL